MHPVLRNARIFNFRSPRAVPIICILFAIPYRLSINVTKRDQRVDREANALSVAGCPVSRPQLPRNAAWFTSTQKTRINSQLGFSTMNEI